MVGIDDSPAMLADAAPHARAGVRFELGDIGAWGGDTAAGDRGDGYDLVLANASLQWVPDHPRVLARWAAALAPARATGGAGADQRRSSVAPVGRRGGGDGAVRIGVRRAAACPTRSPPT